jgi:hypothetical protein
VDFGIWQVPRRIHSKSNKIIDRGVCATMPKKNLLKLPPFVRNQLKQVGNGPIIAACSRVHSAQELMSGQLKHLDVTLTGDRLSFPASVIPPEEGGKYSSRNVNGEKVIRKDLPKETHYHSVETSELG